MSKPLQTVSPGVTVLRIKALQARLAQTSYYSSTTAKLVIPEPLAVKQARRTVKVYDKAVVRKRTKHHVEFCRDQANVRVAILFGHDLDEAIKKLEAFEKKWKAAK